jgi:hypothetical protein
MYLLAGGKWKRRYREEVRRREALEVENRRWRSSTPMRPPSIARATRWSTARASRTTTKGSLCSREPRDGDSVGRSTDVIEPGRLAEGDRGRIAAMFAADAELEARPRSPAPLGRDADQLADALDIQRDERVAGVDALFDVGGEEVAGIVAADAKVSSE